jgi:hypothetical protein
VDCLHLKTRIPLKTKPNNRGGVGQILFSQAKPAACKKNFLLRWDNRAASEAREPKYQIKLDRIERSFRHSDWDAASVCPYFTDMREENDKQGKGGSDRHDDSDGENLSGLMSTMDIGGGEVRPTQPGGQVLQRGPDEAIALPEIEAA